MIKEKNNLKDMVELFKAAGDVNRMKILCAIFDKRGLCVSDIAVKIGSSVATTSHHLKLMERGGLLAPVRSGKKICYALSKKTLVNDIKKIICKYK